MDFPQDPKEQLFLSIKSVFDSWNNQRAIVYRRLNKIPDIWVQQLISKAWYLEIWVMIQVQELHSLVIHLQVNMFFMVNI